MPCARYRYLFGTDGLPDQGARRFDRHLQSILNSDNVYLNAMTPGAVSYLELRAGGVAAVNGGVKSCHWGGAKGGHFEVRALEREALR